MRNKDVIQINANRRIIDKIKLVKDKDVVTE